MNRAAIYRITNLTNGKVYIGSSKDAQKRLYVHRWKLRRERHDNAHLQKAWQQDGEDAFEFAIIEWIEELAIILIREQHWIDKLRAASHYHGYNACPVAGTREGSKQPASMAEKMSAFHKGKPKSAETRAKMSAAALGRKKSPEHRQRLREAAQRQFADPIAREKAAEYGALAKGFKSMKHAPETRAKLSAVHLARYQDPVWLAAQKPRAPASDETREKIAASKRGLKASPETRAKMSAMRLGKKHPSGIPMTDEWKRNHSAKLTGRPRLDRRTPSAEAVLEFKAARASGLSYSALEEQFGVNRKTLHKFINKSA